MSDVATTAGVCIATGSTQAMFCAAFGFDPTLLVGGLVGGLIGCVISQTLIPEKGAPDFRKMLALMVGSVLLAGMATLIGSPGVIRFASGWLSGVPDGAVRLAFGALIGAFAQPIAVIGGGKLMDWLRGFGSKKESGNA